MAPSKRKADNVVETASSKRPKSEKPTSDRKTQASNKSDAENGSSKRREKASEKPESKSILSKELPAFPRGGASLLTPLEKKQINAKAWRDAQREDGAPAADFFGADGADSAGSNLSSDAEADVKPKPRGKDQKAKSSKSKNGIAKIRDTKIGGLNYKRITTGSLVLGQIISISDRDLTVALPNNLVGFVPITAISAQLSAKIQSLLEDSNKDDESEDDDDIDLNGYFSVGQYLRVAVISTGQDVGPSGAHSRKRIELSVEPSAVNNGLSKLALAQGVTVQVSVHSVEDHGLVVDLDLEGSESRGFVPSKNLPSGISIAGVKVGAVMLCQVVKADASNKVIRLSADLSDQKALKNAPSVDAYLPGTVAEILLTEVQSTGLVGKIMGMLTATADLVQSGAYLDKDTFVDKYQVGAKVKGRLICTFPLSDDNRLGFSTLDHVLKLQDTAQAGTQAIGSIVPSATVTTVETGLGIYLSLGRDRNGFAHISRLSDKRVESIEATIGPFKVGSQHKARITDYNAVDAVYIVSLQESVINREFLRLEDVPVGQRVTAVIEKVLIGPTGIKGVIARITESISGYIPEQHLSDAVLSNPEKKFREGVTVKARILSTDLNKRQIRLTLKKSLVNSDAKIWKQYSDITVGDSTVGALVKIDSSGALVQFFGAVKGFLPVAEMSEAYIKDAREHFRVGQVVTVNAISINAEDGRLTVSCRDSNTTDQSSESVVASLKAGSLVTGNVFEKSEHDILLRLENSSAIARLTVDHMSDGSLKKRQAALSKIRVGQRLENLMILDVQPKRRLVVLCNRPSLIKAANNGKLLRSFEELDVGKAVTGVVSNITSDGVYVSFASRISGLITPRNVPEGQQASPDFGMTKLQPVTATVASVDYKGATPRFWLTMNEAAEKAEVAMPNAGVSFKPIADPIDPAIQSEADLTVNTVTKARILSVKDSQLNVELAKDVQGRVDVSEIFDTCDDIKDRKKPLGKYVAKQTIDVKVIGAHDTRNHRFLPLSHRRGKNVVYELSAKPSALRDSSVKPLGYEDLKVGDSYLAFVNNTGTDFVWANISPAIRGRIKIVDISDDLSLAADLMTNFPVGSALRVRVVSVDAEKGRLDLSGKLAANSKDVSIKDISVGQILPGRVTKITDRAVIVSLSDSVVGAIDLIDLSDDYSESNLAKFRKNEIMRVCVVQVDEANKKVSLSVRPSRILSSSLPVADPEVTNVNDLEVNDIYRGFIKHVDDKGIFVMLGHGITAFVRVTHLSDSYLKEWKDSFQRDQLVKGKIISVDKTSGHIQMSLKESILTSDYSPPLKFTDLEVGSIVTGKVAKVEDFGVFIVVDNSEKIRGLCHRSEIAEKRIEDPRKLFSEGDAVKAMVVKVELNKRRVNFGLKASYFDNESEPLSDDQSDSDLEMHDDGDDESVDGMDVDGVSDSDEDAGAELEDASAEDDDIDEDEMASGSSDDSSADEEKKPQISSSLKVGGFDWHGMSSQAGNTRNHQESDAESEKTTEKPKKRKKRADIQVDHTGELDANGPQSSDDFERLLLGEPDSSLLWLQYMAFYINLGDVDQARQIGERALKSIGLGQSEEKQNIWVALLNLEVTYGDDETLDATFKRACEYNDPQEMHSRLVSILIHTQKYDKADEMFQTMLKKYTQSPKIWTNYAAFLFDTKGDADRARELLPRALQTLPKFTHLDLTSKFAQLEFKSEAGVAERGRTIFEGLINSFPKRVDLYNVLLDLETKVGNEEQIRALFERLFTRKLKPKQAKYFFKRWLTFEEQQGDERRVEEVKAKAATWVRSAGQG
ncbi:uncharacterized protein HMPREF1541_03858 [Cyphellophora europaea CBS 101466]|uniref:S1 motif domain-containing protein n=1 Tax=Cyphellophora europaea (strain CBS 101466) TaxID=1220924 RepID=W2S1V0_CYPE1|nr:uncharacterized protein HMPREF1541_03858 [Cyphellophora europaea CBS 101466]ETN41919.1 hypothetical protein HMPREF1541_03858 [Cyphellophora europaea CBS 101466]